MRSLALALLALTLATGCSKSGGASWSGGETLQEKAETKAKAEAQAKTRVSAALHGVWKDSCAVMESGQKSYDNTTTINADGVMLNTSRLFSSTDCTGRAERADSTVCKYTAKLDDNLVGSITVECAEDQFGPKTITKGSIKIDGKTLTLKATSVVEIKNGKQTPVPAEELGEATVLTKVESQEAAEEGAN